MSNVTSELTDADIQPGTYGILEIHGTAYSATVILMNNGRKKNVRVQYWPASGTTQCVDAIGVIAKANEPSLPGHFYVSRHGYPKLHCGCKA